MMVVDRPGEGPYYMTIPLYDCYLAINDLGRVDTDCFIVCMSTLQKNCLMPMDQKHCQKVLLMPWKRIMHLKNSSVSTS